MEEDAVATGVGLIVTVPAANGLEQIGVLVVLMTTL